MKEQYSMFWIVGILAALVGGTYFLSKGEQNVWYYKMTVEVETPEGVRVGEVVRKVKHQEQGGFWFGEGKPQWYLTGEAVSVDMPDCKTLFALLQGAKGDNDYGARIAHRAMGKNGKVTDDPGPVELWPTAPKTIGLANSDTLPLLVTFGDIKDPKSVERVDSDNLAASFGESVRLKRVTIEITREAVTTGIEKRLKWLPDYYGKQFSGDRYQMLKNKDKGLSAYLTAGAFSAGLGLKDREKSK